MNDSDNSNGTDSKAKETKMIPVAYRRGHITVPNPDYPRGTPKSSLFINTEGLFDYDKVNNMLENVNRAFIADGRGVEQIVISEILGNGRDILKLLENKDDKGGREALVSHLAKFIYFFGKIWKKGDDLFIIIGQNRYIPYNETNIAKWICDLSGLKCKSIKSIMPAVSRAIHSYCKQGNRIFSDKTVKEHWYIVNFTNCSYNVIAEKTDDQSIAAKIGYVNASYISKEERGEKDCVMRKFAALCSNDELEQKKLLQALAYAISDYRGNNRLFVFESNNDEPLRIIDSFMKAVLSEEQIRYVPVHSLTDNMNLINVKLIMSKNCRKDYEVEDNDHLHRILSGLPIPFWQEEKGCKLHMEIRNDFVVFYFRKLPIKFIDSLSMENRKLISVIKIQSYDTVKWDEIESSILNELDVNVSYLIDEVLPELNKSGFNLVINESSEQKELLAPENAVSQVKLFISEKCVTGNGYSISKVKLHKAFVEFSGINKRNDFYNIIKELGINASKKGNTHIFENISLKS